jgi:hypothetical protein
MLRVRAAEARVVVVASCLESFSWVVLAAAAAGRPVLVSTGAGAAELSGDGRFFSTFRAEDPELLAALLRPLLADLEYADRRGADVDSPVLDAGYCGSGSWRGRCPSGRLRHGEGPRGRGARCRRGLELATLRQEYLTGAVSDLGQAVRLIDQILVTIP